MLLTLLIYDYLWLNNVEKSYIFDVVWYILFCIWFLTWKNDVIYIFYSYGSNQQMYGSLVPEISGLCGIDVEHGTLHPQAHTLLHIVRQSPESTESPDEFGSTFSSNSRIVWPKVNGVQEWLLMIISITMS